MSNLSLRIWFIITFTLAVISIFIRAIWQIVVIPTPGTMLIFIPILVAIVGINTLFAYLVINPQKFRSLPFIIGVTVALTAGLLAGVSHFIRFFISPGATPLLSKIISSLVLISSVSLYFLLLRILWSLRKPEKA
jgi:hypothetical protein